MTRCKSVKVGIKLERGHGKRSCGHAGVLALNGLEIVAGRLFESLPRRERTKLVEAVQRDDSGKNIRVKSEKNVLVRLFPCAVPAVKNDEPVETITGELRVKNTLERAFFFSVIPDKLGGHRATGDKYDTGPRPWPIWKLFPDQTLAVGITDTTGSQRRLYVSQIGMDNKAISIAAAFARCLRARHLDVSVALGCKSFGRRNVFAVTDDTINRDSEFADEERGHQSKDYENQTKTEFAEFRTHTRSTRRATGYAAFLPALNRSAVGKLPPFFSPADGFSLVPQGCSKILHDS